MVWNHGVSKNLIMGCTIVLPLIALRSEWKRRGGPRAGGSGGEETTRGERGGGSTGQDGN